ncbi:MAG: hypothetical protein NTV30_00230, partial [Chloroflexi bacterium]|nr:hypothetical protein [Chloroflexota bacterium]
MWETEWAIEPLDFVNIDSTIAVSTVNQEKIESAYLLYWGEHCVECVFPDCYKVCPLYVSRRDRRCARFRYGIFPNFALRGTYNYGAEIHFRRWGKLESTLNYGFLPLNIL